MTLLLTHATVSLVESQCWCGIAYAVPANLWGEYTRANDAKPQSMSIYCPLGHAMTRGHSTELKKARDDLARTQSQLDQERAARIAAQAARDKAERKVKRVKNGICPECNRVFQNLARHMKCKHAKVTP